MTEATYEDQELTPVEAFMEKVEALISEDDELGIIEAVGALELIKHRLTVAAFDVDEEDEDIDVDGDDAIA